MKKYSTKIFVIVNLLSAIVLKTFKSNAKSDNLTYAELQNSFKNQDYENEIEVRVANPLAPQSGLVGPVHLKYLNRKSSF